MNKVDITSRSGEIICKNFLPINIGGHRLVALPISCLLIIALILLAVPCMASPVIDSISGTSKIAIDRIGPVPSIGSSGAISVSPSQSTAYTLSACNDGGCVSNNAYIEVGDVAIQPINLMPEPQPEPGSPIQLM